MRAVEDDHVDRPGVQARRRVEPTGTNRPIGLIALVIRVRTGSAAAKAGEARDTRNKKTRSDNAACLPNTALAVAAPCDAQCQTNCDAPVWWPERRAQNPIPSRTRPLNTPAPMVLCLKTRESRSPPDLPIARHTRSLTTNTDPAPDTARAHQSLCTRTSRRHLARGGAAR